MKPNRLTKYVLAILLGFAILITAVLRGFEISWQLRCFIISLGGIIEVGMMEYVLYYFYELKEEVKSCQKNKLNYQ